MSTDRNDRGGMSRRDFVRAAGVGTAGVAGAGALPTLDAQTQERPSTAPPATWDLEADVVVVGSGATGMPAAIRARDAGLSVIVVEANFEVGGKAICSGGQTSLGGGTGMQRKHGFEDSPDQFFHDLTDWSIVEHNKMPEYRYNDRGVQRALADSSALTYDFLAANGVQWRDASPAEVAPGHAVGLSAPRGHQPLPQGPPGVSAYSRPRGGNGSNIIRPLEATARAKGVRFLLSHYMDTVFREAPTAGRVLGIHAQYRPKVVPGSTTPLRSLRSEGNIERTSPTVTIRAHRAVVLATGGIQANVNFRRIFDPRLTEEVQCSVDIWAPQDASGVLAAMALGGSVWGAAAQSQEKVRAMRKPSRVGCRDTYTSGWSPESPVFPLARATGLAVGDWQNVILVNQVGKRFYNELASGWPSGTLYNFLDPYIPGDWRNLARAQYEVTAYNDAALAMNEGSQPPDFGPGPQWAIFDAEAVRREGWSLEPPATDPLYFFSAETLDGLAAKLTQNPFQKVEMPAANLAATVARYNQMVDLGVDPDFDKPTPLHRIETPPFYAGWATIIVHDTYAGLRIDGRCQVVDMRGQVIPGLYAGGEVAGGCSQHGLGRCLTQGCIIGGAIAAESLG